MRHGLVEYLSYKIDLSKDWSNASLELITNERLQAVSPRAWEALWFDTRSNVTYSFGGLQLADYLDNVTSIDSIIGLQTNDANVAAWEEVIGPGSEKPFPLDIFGSFKGCFCSGEKTGYYLGGFILNASSLRALDVYQNRGLLRFDFETLTLTNSSDLGFAVRPNALLNVPVYGPGGLLIALGGGVNTAADSTDLNQINIFDKDSQKWHAQVADGDVPLPTDSYCTVGVQGNGHESFEM